MLALGFVIIGGCGKADDKSGASPISGSGTKGKAPPTVEEAQDIPRNTLRAFTSMKMLHNGEYGFKHGDEDKNGILDFWIADVAGLIKHAMPNQKELAEADASRPSPKPDQGYLFCVMTLDEDGNPYERAEARGRNKNRFAFCGYPAIHGKTGRLTLIINQENLLFQKDTAGKPIKAWPRNPESEGWKILD